MSQVSTFNASVRTASLADAVRHLDGQTFRFDRNQGISERGMSSNAEATELDGHAIVSVKLRPEKLHATDLSSDKLHATDSPQVTLPESVSHADSHEDQIASTNRLMDQRTGRTVTRKVFLEQSRQLVEHLQIKEKELVEREAGHHVRVWNFERNIQQQEKAIAAGHQELEVRESNLRAFQFELVEIQNELIDSQLATRAIVAELELTAPDNDRTEALEGLRDEIVHRYDGLLRTWKRLYERMSDLSNEIQTNRAAA